MFRCIWLYLIVKISIYFIDTYFEITCFIDTSHLTNHFLSTQKVLRKIEELKTRNIPFEVYKTSLEKTIQENLSYTDPAIKASSKEALLMKQKRDTASHFILRAAYCKDEELRRWFLTQEGHLFKFQLDRLSSSSSALQSFLDANKLKFNPVSNEEKKTIMPYLTSILNKDKKIPSVKEVAETTYFKIPFQEATDLIASRQCFVKKGFAYVPMSKIVTIILQKFRSSLSKSLAQASRVFASVTSDFEQISPLLNTMNAQYTGKEYKEDSATDMGGEYSLTSDNVDDYSSNMPLCMRTLHTGLKQDHKLKHHGRLQYGLFLKAAGMSMEESLRFFQKEFTKIMTAEKFQKEYTYNIRHMYGKEGKRTNYSAYNCNKIIMGAPPNTGEHHGCPYRHYDDDHLSSLLNKMQIGKASDRSEIMALKKKKHFTLACQKHFEVSHPKATSIPDLNLSGVGEHPNAWYAASVAYRVAQSGGDSVKEEGKTPEKK